ncbi:hypothetical protein ACEPAI_5524 [Sanghuangporus weigelae]
MPSDRTQADADEEQELRPSRKGGNPLQRGSACLSCRKRKMKCDATKPVCRQCVKANRADECDYDDGRQKSRTQILQEKIAKLEDRIRELESAEEEPFSDEQDYDSFETPLGQDMTTTGFAEEFGHARSIPEGNGFPPSHSPAGSGSGSSSSHNGYSHPQVFSPLMLNAGNPALYTSSVAGPASGPSSQYPHQDQQNPFYSMPEMTVSAPELYGYSMGANANIGMSMNMGYDPSSFAMGMNTHMSGMNIQMHSNMNLGSASSVPINAHAHEQIGLGTGIPHNPSTDLSIPGYSVHDFPQFAGSSSGGSSSAYQNPSTHGTSTMSETSSLGMQQQSPSLASFPNPGSMQTMVSSHHAYGMGTNPLTGPSSGSVMAHQSAALRSASIPSSTSKGKRPMTRWDADILPVQERKILADIFLPHARQCGLYLSPERLYQRLELDSIHLGLFPPQQSQNARQGDSHVPPAHPALTNAIYLLACHFSSVHVPGSSLLFDAHGDVTSGKQTDLSAHESQFLTRALRGIAAALEAGEAAASDSASSRSSRSARSRSLSASASKSVSGSIRGSASPTASSAAASPVVSGFQSRIASRPGTANNIPTSSGSGMITGLGGGVKDDSSPPDVATPLVDAVQASALLAVYFFAKARLLEGYYHASAAARLAVSLGMHQVRSAVWRPPPLVDQSPSFRSSSVGSSAFDHSGASSSTFAFSASSDPHAGSWSGSPTPSPAVLLPPARSALEHAERVALFWHVFFIDRCWSVATGLPSSLPDDEHPQLKISTVWPWDVEPGKEVTRENADYESLGSLFMPTSQGRARRVKSMNANALKAKASAFFERAARLASLQADPTHWEQLTQLEVALDSFIAELPSYTIISPETGPTSNIDPELALVHTLSHAAVIQLHHPRAQKDAHSHSICLSAAVACCFIIHKLGANEYTLLDPVIGTCWMCVGDVLLRERMWGGNMAAVRGMRIGMEDEECAGVEAELDAVVGALKQLSSAFPVALYQVQKVVQSRNASF